MKPIMKDCDEVMKCCKPICPYYKCYFCKEQIARSSCSMRKSYKCEYD